MIIGAFRSIDDDFVGYLLCLGIGKIPVVFFPTASGKNYMIVSSESDDAGTAISFGSASHKKSPKGGHLLVQLDSPIFLHPIKATMQKLPSRQGTYSLIWAREPSVAIKKSLNSRKSKPPKRR